MKSYPAINEVYALEHAQLGRIIGRTRDNDILQFRGIPFADVPGRFRQGILKKSLPQHPFDATNPGPTCPHPPQEYWEYWTAGPRTNLPVLDTPVTDELNCLNLSITLPKAAIGANEKLPVLVFVHGGAFVGGSHAIQLHGREVFDFTEVVRHSLRLDKGIIGVAINYRVGSLGFLASKELSEFNRKNGEAIGNYGLHDQRQALSWVSEFIAGFGGDPQRITVQGTSAGAASCHYQTMFPDRKFHRAILASGTAYGIGPVPEEMASETFDRIWQTVDAERDPLETLLSLDVHTLNNIIPYTVMHPVVDNIWVHSNTALLSRPVQDTDHPLMDIMVGASIRESDIAEFMLRDPESGEWRSDEDAWRMLSKVFADCACIPDAKDFPFHNPDILHCYNLTQQRSPTSQAPKIDLPNKSKAWTSLVGHMLFNYPTYLLANQLKHSGGKVWLFQFDARNPHPASHSVDLSHHGINDQFLFNVAEDQIPLNRLEAWLGAVEQTQKAWIEFTNGESPWTPVNAASKELGPVFVFADGDASHERPDIEQGFGSELAKGWDVVRNGLFRDENLSSDV